MKYTATFVKMANDPAGDKVLPTEAILDRVRNIPKFPPHWFVRNLVIQIFRM